MSDIIMQVPASGQHPLADNREHRRTAGAFLCGFRGLCGWSMQVRV